MFEETISQKRAQTLLAAGLKPVRVDTKGRLVFMLCGPGVSLARVVYQPDFDILPGDGHPGLVSLDFQDTSLWTIAVLTVDDTEAVDGVNHV